MALVSFCYSHQDSTPVSSRFKSLDLHWSKSNSSKARCSAWALRQRLLSTTAPPPCWDSSSPGWCPRLAGPGCRVSRCSSSRCCLKTFWKTQLDWLSHLAGKNLKKMNGKVNEKSKLETSGWDLGWTTITGRNNTPLRAAGKKAKSHQKSIAWSEMVKA